MSLLLKSLQLEINHSKPQGTLKLIVYGEFLLHDNNVYRIEIYNASDKLKLSVFSSENPCIRN